MKINGPEGPFIWYYSLPGCVKQLSKYALTLSFYLTAISPYKGLQLHKYQ